MYFLFRFFGISFYLSRIIIESQFSCVLPGEQCTNTTNTIKRKSCSNTFSQQGCSQTSELLII